MSNLRAVITPLAPYGEGLTNLRVKFTPTQSGTPWQSDEVNNAPYVFRQIPMGNREWNKLVGGTVAWNQMATVYTGTRAGVTVADGGSGVVTLSGTTSVSYFATHTVQAFTQNHVYFMHLVVDANPNSVPFSFLPYNLSGDFGINQNGGTKIAKWTSASKNSSIGVGSIATNVSVNGIELRYTLVDLTQMFGSTIADYVYSLEQATAGSGIQWLKDYDLIDDQYHAYSQGSLESVNVSAHVMRDADNNIIETYPIDSSVTLRGMLKTDADGNLYYDGDTYEWDGTVTRKYGYVDLGTLNWYRSNSGSIYAFRNETALANLKVKTVAASLMNAITANYTQIASGFMSGLTADKEWIGATDGHIYIRDDAYTTAADFKTAMSGVYLVYELDTPTTESADPFTNPQVCDPDGTEEWTDYGVEQGTRDYAVPVGHESTYAMAYPIEGVDSFTVTANDGTSHTYPVTLSEEIYRGYVDMLTGEAVSDMASIAEYNGETISEPWLSSLDVYSAGATPTNGAQVVYPITPEEVTATITGDPTELGEVTSVTSTKGTVKWDNYTLAGLRAEITVINPFE